MTTLRLIVALVNLGYCSTLATAEEQKIQATATIPVYDSRGNPAYVDLDSKSSSLLYASLRLAREAKDGWRKDSDYQYHPVLGNALIGGLGGEQDSDSVLLSEDWFLVFKEDAWRSYSDPFVKKLLSALAKSKRAPIDGYASAMKRAENLRSALEAVGIGSVVRKEERKVGKATAMISFTSEGGGEVIVDLPHEIAEELYKEFRDAKNQNDGWVAKDQIVHSSTRSEVLLAYDGSIRSFSFAPTGLNMEDDRRCRTITSAIAKKLADCQAKAALNVSRDVDSATLAQRFVQELNAQEMKAVVRKKK